MGTAERIIAKYGHTAFRRLLDDLHAGICLSKIAVSMGVTRQCVSQWKKLLGYPSLRWEPHPCVEEFIDARIEGES